MHCAWVLSPASFKSFLYPRFPRRLILEAGAAHCTLFGMGEHNSPVRLWQLKHDCIVKKEPFITLQSLSCQKLISHSKVYLFSEQSKSGYNIDGYLFFALQVNLRTAMINSCVMWGVFLSKHNFDHLTYSWILTGMLTPEAIRVTENWDKLIQVRIVVRKLLSLSLAKIS